MLLGSGFGSRLGSRLFQNPFHQSIIRPVSFVEVRLVGERWEQISELSAVQIRHNGRAPSKFVSVLDSKPGLLHGFNVWRMALRCEH